MIIIIAYVFHPVVAAHSVVIIKMEGLEEVKTLQYIKISLSHSPEKNPPDNTPTAQL